MNTEKRIWYLNSNRWNSAITEYALSFSRSVQGSVGAQLLSGLENRPYLQRAAQDGFETTAHKGFGFLQWPELDKVGRDFNPTHLVCFGGPEHSFVRAGFASRNTVQSIRFRGQPPRRQGFFSQLGARLLSHRTQQWVVPGSSLLPSKTDGNVGWHCIPIGLDADRYCFQSQSWENRQYTDLLIFGRLDPVKGHREFLSVFFEVWKNHKNRSLPIRLRIVGQEANIGVDEIMDLASKLGIPKLQILVENQRVDNPANLISAATLGVVCSLGSEWICRVAEEFLLCGTPVLVSGVGSLKDVLLDDSFGAHYQGKDLKQKEELTSALLDRYADESSEQRKARSILARQHFSFPAMGDRILKELLL